MSRRDERIKDDHRIALPEVKRLVDVKKPKELTNKESKKLPPKPDEKVEMVGPSDIRDFVKQISDKVSLRDQQEAEESAERKAIRGE